MLAELQNAGSVLEACEVLDALAKEVRGLPDVLGDPCSP